MKISPIKKIFVTGATGFVGSNLIRKFLNLNFEVHIASRKSSNFWRIQDCMQKIKVHEVNLLDMKNLKKTLHKIKPSAIFHLANSPLLAGSEKNTQEYLDVNVLTSINLIEGSLDLDYECFINTGSSSEYGNKSKPMHEDDLCEPESIYGITKLTSTLCATMYAKKYNKPIVTLRLFSPYGPFDHSLRLIPYVVVNALKNKEIIINSPNTIRDYIYIDDCLNAYVACIKNSTKLRGGVINIGSGIQTKTKDVVKLVLKKINSQSKIIWENKISTRYESKTWKADIRKAKDIINWQPQFNISMGLSKTIKWFKVNMNYY